jgi:hypothetical protein
MNYEARRNSLLRRHSPNVRRPTVFLGDRERSCVRGDLVGPDPRGRDRPDPEVTVNGPLADLAGTAAGYVANPNGFQFLTQSWLPCGAGGMRSARIRRPGESFPLVNGLDPGVSCCSCRQMFLCEGRQVVQLHLHLVDRR